MKYGLSVLMVMLFFAGCTRVEPKVPIVNNNQEVGEVNQTEVVLENNLSSVPETVSNDVNIIVNVFDDTLYFEKDKVSEEEISKVVIKYLDAFDWEKKALQKAYTNNKSLWSKKQSEDFRKILEEDKYFSLCSDQRYWDNLEFEESEPERDVLHSVLLIKYLNNLTHGCPKWVESKVKDENKKEHINTQEIFRLLPHNVIIEKLFYLYMPHTKKFDTLIKEHQTLLSRESEQETIKAHRLEIEAYKNAYSNPKYKN